MELRIAPIGLHDTGGIRGARYRARAFARAVGYSAQRSAQNGHAPGELPPKPAANSGRSKASGGTVLAYKMIAERDNETVKVERKSSLIIVAKARVWASEGWQVVITDADGKSYAPAEFDRLLAA